MNRPSLQTRQVVLYLLTLGLFSLCVLAVAAYRGNISTQISNDVGDAGRLRSYALMVYIDQKDPARSIDADRVLHTMGDEIRRLLARYPGGSSELILAWKEFYTKAQPNQLTSEDTQIMVDAAHQFLLEIKGRANEEARIGYWMLLFGAFGLTLLIVRGFVMVRELSRAELNLRNSEQRFAILAEASLEGIAISENGIIEDANTQFSKLLGYEPGEVIGRHLVDFAHREDVDRSKEAIQNDQEITYEITCVRKDNSIFPAEITARTLQFTDKSMRLTVARDITVRKEMERNWKETNKSLAISNERWRALATLDSLTGAYTRRALHLSMLREIRRASHSGTPFSVIILDMNGFKQYNDKFGHIAGDAVLRRVVELLRNTLRDVDIVARYGGDEFVLILVNTGELEAKAVARRCYEVIENETTFKMPLSAGIGVITCFIETEHPVKKEFSLEIAKEILLRVDRALYESKLKEHDHITIAATLRINNNLNLTASKVAPSNSAGEVVSTGHLSDALLEDIL